MPPSLSPGTSAVVREKEASEPGAGATPGSPARTATLSLSPPERQVASEVAADDSDSVISSNETEVGSPRGVFVIPPADPLCFGGPLTRVIEEDRETEGSSSVPPTSPAV